MIPPRTRKHQHRPCKPVLPYLCVCVWYIFDLCNAYIHAAPHNGLFDVPWIGLILPGRESGFLFRLCLFFFFFGCFVILVVSSVNRTRCTMVYRSQLLTREAGLQPNTCIAIYFPNHVTCRTRHASTRLRSHESHPKGLRHATCLVVNIQHRNIKDDAAQASCSTSLAKPILTPSFLFE